MRLFAIADNTITTFPAAEQIPEGHEHFASENELFAASTTWPADRLVQIWNSFAGIAGFGADLKPVKKFADRKSAVARIWKAIQKLDGAGQAEAESATAPEATAAAGAAPAKAAQGARKAAKVAPAKAKASKAAKPAKKAATATAPRESSKKEIVISMMSRKAGATLDEIIAETGWARHTVRGFVSGMVVKKLDMKVESAKNADGQRTYRVTK